MPLRTSMLLLSPKTSPLLVLFVLLATFCPRVWADGGTEPPVPVRTVPPEVPSDFANGGSAGLVTVSMMIDEKGNVTEVSVVKSTHKELEEPAMEAVKKWRFKPAKKDGNPVAIRVAIPIKFDVS